MMNFMASAEINWMFILAAISQAASDVELDHIAAGPLESFLSRHGETQIERIERHAAHDPTFARTMTGVRRHLMTADVWQRVQRIQLTVPDPLRMPD
jgi:hypothetical protein